MSLAADHPIEFRVSTPVSANDYKRIRVIPGGRIMFYLTREAKAYKDEVGWAARAAGCREPTKLPVEVELTLLPRSNQDGSPNQGRLLDVGNVEKVALDAMQGIVFRNDRQVKRLVVGYGEPVEGGGLVVRVRVFVAAVGGLFGGDQS